MSSVTVMIKWKEIVLQKDLAIKKARQQTPPSQAELQTTHYNYSSLFEPAFRLHAQAELQGTSSPSGLNQSFTDFL